MAHILIVDDDEILSDVVAEALTIAGHLVSAVHRGDEAVSAVDASSAELLILDYDFPSISGLEVLRQVRQRPYSQTLSVSMLTAKNSRLLPARAHREGIDDFMVKPAAPGLLTRRVEALLKSAALERRVASFALP